MKRLIMGSNTVHRMPTIVEALSLAQDYLSLADDAIDQGELSSSTAEMMSVKAKGAALILGALLADTHDEFQGALEVVQSDLEAMADLSQLVTKNALSGRLSVHMAMTGRHLSHLAAEHLEVLAGTVKRSPTTPASRERLGSK